VLLDRVLKQQADTQDRGLKQPYGKVTTTFGFSGGTGPVDVAACLMAAGPKHDIRTETFMVQSSPAASPTPSTPPTAARAAARTVRQGRSDHRLHRAGQRRGMPRST
jgi:hypothetical protein